MNINQNYTFHKITWRDLPTDGKPGFPQLPKKILFIDLPVGARNISLNSTVLSTKTYILPHKIYPSQEIFPISDKPSSLSFTSAIDSIYSSKNPYPDNITEVLNISQLGDTKQILCIQINPTIYYPKENKLILNEQIELTIKYDNDPSNQKQSILNKAITDVEGIPSYEYVIITNKSLTESVTFLQNVTLKKSQYLFVSDLTCGNNVRNGSNGNVVFEKGTKTTIEASGKVKLDKGTVIQSGATLCIKPMSINH